MPKYGDIDGGFLTDYTPIASAGAAFKGFVSGLQDAQDRQMKRQEFDAKMKAMQIQAEREAMTQQIEMHKNHVMKAADGSLTDAPLTGAGLASERLNEFKAGAKAKTTDANGYATDYEYDPSTLAAEKLKAQTAARAAANAFRGEGLEARKDAMDRREHEAVLKRLSSNKIAQQRLGQYQGLDNALSMITQVDHLTPQSINEFQQALRSQVTAAQRSGVAERGEDYFHNLGLNSANWMQFLTGNPADLAKDSELVKHLINSAKVEQGNINRQYERALNAATGGHSSMYGRRDDLKADLQSAIQSYMDQMQTVNPQNTAQAPAQGGLVTPGLIRRPGVLTKVGDWLMGPSAEAGNKSGVDPTILNYAQKYNLTYEDAARLLSMPHRQGGR